MRDHHGSAHRTDGRPHRRAHRTLRLRAGRQPPRPLRALLDLSGRLMTLPEHHLDDDVAAHRGDPFAEQRARTRTAAVVDRSHRGIIAVSGPDRLEWLHLLLTQHVSALPDGAATEALVL